jgi:hypothetical protein
MASGQSSEEPQSDKGVDWSQPIWDAERGDAGAAPAADPGTKAQGASGQAEDAAEDEADGDEVEIVIRLERLGVRLDGWADLVDGAGDKAAEVRARLRQHLEARRIESVETYNALAPAGDQHGELRPCLLAETASGASVVVLVGESGQDLYVAWEAFVQPAPNAATFILLAGAASVLGFFSSLLFDFGPRSVMDLLLWIIIWLVLGAVFVAGAGKLQRDSVMAFFSKPLEGIDAHDTTAVLLAVHKSVLKVLEGAGVRPEALRPKERFWAGSAAPAS